MKMAVSSDWERESIREEFLKSIERKLKLQKRKCQQLTMEIKEKERLQEAEKKLRDEQLGKIVRALFLFEARLREEQKLIVFQMEEKDRVIERQRQEIKNLLMGNSNLIPFDDSSNSEYSMVTDYQSSNFDSCSTSSNNRSNGTTSANETKLLASPKLGPKSASSNSSSNCAKEENKSIEQSNATMEQRQAKEENKSKISDIITVFESDPSQANDDWYASVSDQEEGEEGGELYKENPVLECMNQILLQNVHDTAQNSPPKTPQSNKKEIRSANKTESENYYETPIQKTPNVYETPQSVFTNEYEQILNRCTDTLKEYSSESHYYVDVEMKAEKELKNGERKSKIQRTPPALPPKPFNLMSKHRIKSNVQNEESDRQEEDSEPNYCSISEINLPTTKAASVNEIKLPNDKLPKPTLPPPKKKSPEIPKLPQVTEIIIPEDTNGKPKRVGCDNYIKNNTQFTAKRTINRRPSIQMGSSVSSLIATFNNKQSLSEHDQKKLKSQVTNATEKEFDLSQNFEEFKLDECEFKDPPAKSNVDIPKLDVHIWEKLQQQLRFQRKCHGKEPSYEHFLECTGLSSKSILNTPKNRKFIAKSGNECRNKYSIKYWSAPYL